MAESSSPERPAATGFREVAPGVSVGPGARRILHSGDPRGEDYRAAEQRVREVRSQLSRLRAELEDLGKIEARFPHDRLCDKVAGSLTLGLIALHGLMDESERSFGARADRLDELWADVAANPDAYVIKDGATWEWRR